MTITKVDESFYELTGRRISNISQLKLFSILRDHDSTHFMNIWRTFSFNNYITTDVTFYDSYEVGDDMWWDNISYDIYGTPHLWWIVALMNNVVNPFEELEEGTNIKILREEYLYVLFKDIERLSDLGT